MSLLHVISRFSKDIHSDSQKYCTFVKLISAEKSLTCYKTIYYNNFYIIDIEVNLRGGQRGAGLLCPYDSHPTSPLSLAIHLACIQLACTQTHCLKPCHLI